LFEQSRGIREAPEFLAPEISDDKESLTWCMFSKCATGRDERALWV
jgi:hypothetical protein